MITDLNIRIDKFTKIQLDVALAVDKAHHYGEFKLRKGNSLEYGVTGTLKGFLGLHPTDTGMAHLQKCVVTYPISTYVQTYDWDQQEDGIALWRHMLDVTWSDQNPHRPLASYPQLAFPACLGAHWDPDPPSPSLHKAGLAYQLQVARGNTDQDKALWKTLTAWHNRVIPVVESLQQFIDLDM